MFCKEYTDKDKYDRENVVTFMFDDIYAFFNGLQFEIKYIIEATYTEVRFSLVNPYTQDHISVFLAPMNPQTPIYKPNVNDSCTMTIDEQALTFHNDGGQEKYKCKLPLGTDEDNYRTMQKCMLIIDMFYGKLPSKFQDIYILPKEDVSKDYPNVEYIKHKGDISNNMTIYTTPHLNITINVIQHDKIDQCMVIYNINLRTDYRRHFENNMYMVFSKDEVNTYFYSADEWKHTCTATKPDGSSLYRINTMKGVLSITQYMEHISVQPFRKITNTNVISTSTGGRLIIS